MSLMSLVSASRLVSRSGWRIAALLALTGMLAACSMVRLAYNNADTAVRVIVRTSQLGGGIGDEPCVERLTRRLQPFHALQAGHQLRDRLLHVIWLLAI